MTIEQSLVRRIKVSEGLTHGRGTTSSVKAQWILETRTTTKVCQVIEEFAELAVETSEQHVDWRDSRRNRDQKDVEKLIL